MRFNILRQLSKLTTQIPFSITSLLQHFYKMDMFQSFLNAIPKNRSEFVNELEIPEITLEPFVWPGPNECPSEKSDSLVADSMEDDKGSLSTDSSLPLSRAMTDSDIDYGRYRRMRNRRFSDPWDQLKSTMDDFPPEYIASLHKHESFQKYNTDSTEEIVATCVKDRIRRRNDKLLKKMKKYYDDECRAFSPDDPGLLALEEAVKSLNLKAYDSDLDDLSA